METLSAKKVEVYFLSTALEQNPTMFPAVPTIIYPFGTSFQIIKNKVGKSISRSEISSSTRLLHVLDR